MKSIYDDGRIFIVQDEETGELNIDLHEVDGCYLGSTRTMRGNNPKDVLYRARHLNVTRNQRASDDKKPPKVRLTFFSGPKDEKALSMKKLIVGI